MTEIIHKKTTKLSQIGNSIGVIYPKTYREMSGMEEIGQKIEIAAINSKNHGIFLGQFLPGTQPQLEDIEESKLEEIILTNTQRPEQ